MTIEDFLDANAYRLAVNEDLRRSGATDHGGKTLAAPGGPA
jgi:hypothetical protein